MRRFPALFLLAATVLAQQGTLKPPPEKAATGFKTINPDDAKTWLGYLAGEECEGRGSGQAGFQKAADYVAGHFKEWGLKPVGDKGPDGKPTYFQMVPFTSQGFDPGTVRAEILGGQGPMTLKVGEGFGITGRGKIEADASVVFLVAAATDKKLDDLGLEGKVVVAVGYGPGDGEFPTTLGFLNEIRKQKPAAIFRIDDVGAARGVVEGDWNLKRPSREPSGDGSESPNPRRSSVALLVSRDIAAKIAAAAGLDLAKLVEKAKASGSPTKTATKLRAVVKAESKAVEKGVPNVVGYLEGSDPSLKKELLIFGSHLDHLGRAAGGEMYPGADDDGSGTTALLLIARSYAQNGKMPKRSVLFIAVCGEEKGLLGSEWYVEHPIFPLADTVAELQMDMVGRHEEAHPSENPGNEKAEDNVNSLHLVGSKKISTQLHDIILKTNEDHVGFDFEYDGEKYYTRSDHYNFAKKGIPVSFVFTGVHRDYHETTDTPDKIDYPKLARVAKLMYLVGFEIADRKARLVSDVKSR
jgi:hypothetical protein